MPTFAKAMLLLAAALAFAPARTLFAAPEAAKPSPAAKPDVPDISDSPLLAPGIAPGIVTEEVKPVAPEPAKPAAPDIPDSPLLTPGIAPGLVSEETKPARPATDAPPVAPVTPPAQKPAAAAGPVNPLRLLFEAQLPNFSRRSYDDAVSGLFTAFETRTGRALKPGRAGSVGLKIYTESGPGIATPKNLVRAAIRALERRGFERGRIYIVDLSERTLRESGYLAPLRVDGGGVETFEGCPVLALDTGKYYSRRWFYENPLPSREIFAKQGDFAAERMLSDKQSMLPASLFLQMDFWLNLAVALDSPALGVSGALGNATIWNISNQRRFLDNPANAQKVAIEVAAIPEFQRSLVFHVLALERYQFVGGPKFDANHCVSEPRLWLSANPLVLDFLMLGRINNARERKGFPRIEPEPEMFVRGNTPPILLGSCRPSEIELVTLKPPAATAAARK
ncbi:MAG: hypothetical protein LBR07_10565 [Puniceicoccales bacterium]|jgi:hypothetical protein|nr:hypothetical protein [Puniceicoccales bacterium]